jgi:hypothetical protein
LDKYPHFLLTAVTDIKMRTTKTPAAAPEIRMTVGEKSDDVVFVLVAVVDR